MQPLKHFFIVGIIDQRQCTRHSKMKASQLAHDQVVFILGGRCQQSVGTVRPGFAQNRQVTAVAMHDGALETTRKSSALPLIVIDDDDIVALGGKQACQKIDQLFPPHDDYFHRSSPLPKDFSGFAYDPRNTSPATVIGHMPSIPKSR